MSALIQRSLIYLEFKNNEFLLARIAPKDADLTPRIHMIKAAHAMLNCVVALWTERDFLVDFQSHFGVVVSPPSLILYKALMTT